MTCGLAWKVVMPHLYYFRIIKRNNIHHGWCMTTFNYPMMRFNILQYPAIFSIYYAKENKTKNIMINMCLIVGLGNYL
jgi:hypothetical protein